MDRQDRTKPHARTDGRVPHAGQRPARERTAVPLRASPAIPVRSHGNARYRLVRTTVATDPLRCTIGVTTDDSPLDRASERAESQTDKEESMAGTDIRANKIATVIIPVADQDAAVDFY